MNILVATPHPDDETLGCGGYLLKQKENGNSINWLIFTSVKGVSQFDKISEKRDNEILHVSKAYGFDRIVELKYPTTRMDELSLSKLVSDVGRVMDEIQPDVLILPDRNDAHSDHRIVFDCCWANTKIFRHKYIKKIMTMEILSETNFGSPYEVFMPNYYVDISDFLEKKIEIMNIYSSEIGKHPFPRSKEAIRSLAVLRGTQSNSMYAEAFRILKEID